MKISVDTEAGTVSLIGDPTQQDLPLSSAQGFALVSRAWVRAGWDAKQVYSFTWFGRPVIQLPEDMVRVQELVWTLKPDLIVETGIAHGGSLIFYASLFEAIGKGHVVGVDVEIRPPNRRAIEEHPLARRITLVEGNSVAPEVVRKVKEFARGTERVLVLLDSKHTKDHVLQELEAYSPLVSVGSYIVAMDGVMEQLAGAPRTSADWTWNNPSHAAREFAARNPSFIIEEPPFAFNEGTTKGWVTYWPDGFLRRISR